MNAEAARSRSERRGRIGALDAKAIDLTTLRLSFSSARYQRASFILRDSQTEALDISAESRGIRFRCEDDARAT